MSDQENSKMHEDIVAAAIELNGRLLVAKASTRDVFQQALTIAQVMCKEMPSTAAIETIVEAIAIGNYTFAAIQISENFLPNWRWLMRRNVEFEEPEYFANMTLDLEAKVVITPWTTRDVSTGMRCPAYAHKPDLALLASTLQALLKNGETK